MITGSDVIHRIVITGGIYNGPVQQLNKDEQSDVLWQNNVGKEDQ